MTVTVQTPLTEYTAAPGATIFATSFRLIAPTDLKVLKNGVAITSGFTVTGFGQTATATVTFTTPMVGGEIIQLRRVIKLERLNNYQFEGDFQANVVNEDYDRLWMSQQDQELSINQNNARTLRAPIGETLSEMPNAAARANKIQAFDSTGLNPIYVLPGTGTASEVLIDLANQTNASLGASLIPTTARVVNFINAVNAVGLPDGIFILAKNRSVVNDGGGGWFTYSFTSIEAVDNVAVFAPSAGPGRLISNEWQSSQVKGNRNLLKFGANNLNASPAVNSTAITNALVIGGKIDIPDGTYAFSNAFAASYDGVFPLIGAPSKRYEIEGASRNNTVFTYSGNGYFFTSVGSSNLATEGIHSYDSLSKVAFLSATPYLNNCIKYDGKAYFKISDIHINGFSEALRIDSCFTGKLNDVYLRDNNYGLLLSGATFPRAPNAIYINRLTCQLNKVWGILGESVGECLVIDGATIENNGTQGNLSTGGIQLAITTAANGFGSASLRGIYFEQNKGVADVLITNSGAQKVVISIDSCFFNRAYVAEHTVNNIRVRNTGSGSVTVTIKNCSFFSTNTYVSSNTRPFFDIGAGCELINGGGNSYSEIVSLPQAPAFRPGVSSEVSILRMTSGAGLLTAPVGVTVTTPSAGVYIFTHPKGWAADTDSYSVQAVSNDTGGNILVQRISQNSATQFTVVVVVMTTNIQTNSALTISVTKMA
jgi:hypothetical protein